MANKLNNEQLKERVNELEKKFAESRGGGNPMGESETWDDVGSGIGNKVMKIR